MNEKSSGGFGWFLFGLALGGIAGAAVALAYAPESGEDTREHLRERGIELQGQAQKVAGKVRERVGEIQRQAEAQIGQVRQQVEQGVQAARQYTEGLSEQMQGTAEQTETEEEGA